MRLSGKTKWPILQGFKNTAGLMVGFIVAQACSPMYIPNSVNSPLLTKKGECKVSASMGSNGYNAMIAVSPINHIGLITNASINNKPEPSFRNYSIGGGYYGTFSELKLDFTYEFFAGGGQGEISNIGSFSHHKEDGNYNQYFLQSGFGFENQILGAGLAARMNFVDMQIYNHYYSRNNRYKHIYLEPALTLKGGYNNVKFIVQIILAVRAENKDIDYYYEYRPLVISCGLQITLGRKFTITE